MQPNERLEDLLLAWQESQSNGDTPSVEKLCRQAPELAEPLTRGIDVLRKMQQLVEVLHGPEAGLADTGTGASTGAGAKDEGPSLAPNDQVAGCLIERLLGKGGMGEVYLARDPMLNRLVAVKVMRSDLALNRQARERFLREARAVAALQDDHVVTIHAVGEDAGRLFLVMPLLRGESLGTRLKRTPRLSVAEALRITREAAQGLAAAHWEGLVHRDVKPANLWLEEGSDRVKVLDFGLARQEKTDGLTGSGAFCGTPGYAAPEQIDGATPAPSADLFGLGCVLYRMLTGREAFAGATVSAVLLAAVRCEPESPAVHEPTLPAGVVDLVMRLLSREPADRPATAETLIGQVRDLEREAQGAPTLPAPIRPVRRRGWLIGAALVGVAVLGGLGLAAWWKLQKSPPTTKEPLRGDVDLLVWKANEIRGEPEGTGKRLSLPGVLPLRKGDLMRIEVEMERPVYVYIVWLEASGAAVPIYPWKGRQWDERSAEEPRRVVTLPQREGLAASPLGGGPSGVETILLLARDEPLPAGAEAELREVFRRGWKPTPLKETGAFAAWLENGESAKEHNRGAIVDEESREIVSPLMQVQRLLKRDLQPWFGYSRAVCYGFQGD